ncbi:MAG TPA: rod-binding protein [Alphaproteobacteria bacterium]|nr:MAG: rod-binding protein [Rhodospirillales bacterium]HOO82284.1 rod-binding protein [Alphaproteobacteria bacterium]
MAGSLTPDTNMALLQASQTNPGKAAKTLKDAAKSHEMQKIEAAAQDFEAVFIAEMMKPMFAGIETQAPFGGGKGEEIFRGMMIQEYGKMIAQTGGIGIADHVKDHMIQVQSQMQNEQNPEGATSDE